MSEIEIHVEMLFELTRSDPSLNFVFLQLKEKVDLQTFQLDYYRLFISRASSVIAFWGGESGMLASLVCTFVLQKKKKKCPNIYNLCNRESLTDLFKKEGLRTLSSLSMYYNLYIFFHSGSIQTIILTHSYNTRGALITEML